MTGPMRRVNKIIDELIKRELTHPPRYANGNIMEAKIVARVFDTLQDSQYADVLDEGDAYLWGSHLKQRLKQVTQKTKGTPVLSEEYIGELQRLADAGNGEAEKRLIQWRRHQKEQFRKYHRVPTGNGFALREHEEVTVEDNRRLKGQYRKRRLENARYESYHGDIDTLAQVLGMADEGTIGQLVQIVTDPEALPPPGRAGNGSNGG
jgi:hypothetical protein